MSWWWLLFHLILVQFTLVFELNYFYVVLWVWAAPHVLMSVTVWRIPSLTCKIWLFTLWFLITVVINLKYLVFCSVWTSIGMHAKGSLMGWSPPAPNKNDFFLDTMMSDVLLDLPFCHWNQLMTGILKFWKINLNKYQMILNKSRRLDILIWIRWVSHGTYMCI